MTTTTTRRAEPDITVSRKTLLVHDRRCNKQDRRRITHNDMRRLVTVSNLMAHYLEGLADVAIGPMKEECRQLVVLHETVLASLRRE